MSDQVPAFNLQTLKDPDLSWMSPAKLTHSAPPVGFMAIEHSYHKDHALPFPNNLTL